MNKNLNLTSENCDIVFVALNPTREAINNGAVFSRDNSFWNILEKAGLIKTHAHIKLSEKAIAVFGKNLIANYKMGIVDLLPDIIETDSRKVKVPLGKARKLAVDLAALKTKKIALMGQKVVDAFARDFKVVGLPDWRRKMGYGKIGGITINGHLIEVFALPFPVNNNVFNKSELYGKLVE